MSEFCVYIHKRPDGDPFYVGKGRTRRANEFAPSRRTLHHKNIIAKYGRDNIIVEIIPCSNEEEAFALEVKTIKRRG
jgi:excinuclease UvrABC nuclease subunit